MRHVPEWVKAHDQLVLHRFCASSGPSGPEEEAIGVLHPTQGVMARIEGATSAKPTHPDI
jgi:hypothetical protein